MVFAKVQVSEVYAHAEYHKLIPAGIIGAQVEFKFTDPKWDGLTKTVVFKGFGTKDVQLKGDTTLIPAEVVSRAHVKLKVGVYGTDANETIAIPTLWADLGEIRDAADPSGDPAADPDLPIWAEIQADIKELQENGVAVDMDSIERGIQEYLKDNPPAQFKTDATLTLRDGILSVNTTNDMERDNTLPITSAGVYATVGNIEALLKTI